MHDELLRLPWMMKVEDKMRATQGRHVSASPPPNTTDKWQESINTSDDQGSGSLTSGMLYAHFSLPWPRPPKW